jgi:hypothetical protein
MRPTLRRLHSPDAPDLERFTPNEPKHFGVLVQAMLGPENGEGEESFDFIMCTPSWLQARLGDDMPKWGRGYLLANEYCYADLLSIVTGLCRSVEAENWTGVAQQLARFTRWEFDDYRTSL